MVYFKQSYEHTILLKRKKTKAKHFSPGANIFTRLFTEYNSEVYKLIQFVKQMKLVR